MSATPSQGAPVSGGRLQLSPAVLNLAVATYLLAVTNASFWSRLDEIFGATPLAQVTFAAAVWALMVMVVSALAVRWAQKPVLIAFIVIAAVASFYTDRLGVLIDRDMIQNALTTTVAEGKHLITGDMATHVALRAVPGIAFVLWVRVVRARMLWAAVGWAGMVVGAFALTFGLLFTDLKSFSTVLRGRKDLMGSVQPLAPIGGALRYAKMMLKSAKIETQPFGRDAIRGARLETMEKPVLMVIVAGETGRAQSWSLSGYERDTNPELAKRDITYFTDVASCGTATATSLPCMFSHLTAGEYSYGGGLAHENLLDVLTHAGVHVEWWDNNTGSKNIADRVPSRFMTAEDDAAACASGECIDAVFLPKLRQVAETMTEDTVIVIHQIGSHGPSYWLRYPPEEEVFQPACHSEELTKCSTEEIVNAYDNTIRYTDQFLSQVIDLLAESDRVAGAMYYVSDHGESLGENGIYLHGTPMFMAPEVQYKVPMVIWTSEGYRKGMAADPACLKARADQPISHDNLFSTVLGMMDIATETRDPALDLTFGCEKNPA